MALVMVAVATSVVATAVVTNTTTLTATVTISSQETVENEHLIVVYKDPYTEKAISTINLGECKPGYVSNKEYFYIKNISDSRVEISITGSICEVGELILTHGGSSITEKILAPNDILVVATQFEANPDASSGTYKTAIKITPYT